MWLGLYQSDSIWLVRELLTCPTQRSTEPQVQMGGRPIRVSKAAVAATMRMAAAAARVERVIRGEVSRRKRLANHCRSNDQPLYAPSLRTELRRQRHRSGQEPANSRRRDLDRPRGTDARRGERRTLHDAERALRRRGWESAD